MEEPLIDPHDGDRDIIFVDPDRSLDQTAGETKRLCRQVGLFRNFIDSLVLNRFVQVTINTRRMMISEFIGGIINGVIAVIGIGTIIAVIVYLLGPLRLVPVIGDFIVDIIEEIGRRVNF